MPGLDRVLVPRRPAGVLIGFRGIGPQSSKRPMQTSLLRFWAARHLKTGRHRSILWGVSIYRIPNVGTVQVGSLCRLRGSLSTEGGRSREVGCTSDSVD